MELDLYGLAVCAIMSSGELDAEGLTTLALAGGSGSTTVTNAVSQVIISLNFIYFSCYIIIISHKYFSFLLYYLLNQLYYYHIYISTYFKICNIFASNSPNFHKKYAFVNIFYKNHLTK